MSETRRLRRTAKAPAVPEGKRYISVRVGIGEAHLGSVCAIKLHNDSASAKQFVRDWTSANGSGPDWTAGFMTVAHYLRLVAVVEGEVLANLPPLEDEAIPDLGPLKAPPGADPELEGGF